jgi:hypothetical protein
MSKCWCFPVGNALEEECRKKVKDEYLGEKSCPIIRKWLGSGIHFVRYDLVKYYALSDFYRYVCSDKTGGCAVLEMSEEIFLADLDNAIKEMATPCEC